MRWEDKYYDNTFAFSHKCTVFIIAVPLGLGPLIHFYLT